MIKDPNRIPLDIDPNQKANELKSIAILSAQRDFRATITAIPTQAKQFAKRRRWFLSLSSALSPDTTLHLGILSLADQAVASATNFFTGVVIARACSKEELGLYMLGFSLILLMTDLQTSLIATPYMVYAPRLKGRAHALYTGSTLIHQLAFCFFTMLGLACGSFAISSGIGPRALGPVLWALALVSALIMLREYARRVSFARLALRTAFIFDTAIALCQIAGLLVLARFGLLSASRAYWMIGVVCGIVTLAWLWWDKEFYDPQIGESRADLKKNWVLGKWVFASGLVWAVSMNLYPWLLAAFHGVASSGIWAACLGVVSIGNPVLSGIQNVAGPKIAHEYAAKGYGALHRLVFRLNVVFAVPTILLCFAILVWGDHLLTLLYGRQYAGNTLVVSVLALNLLVSAIAFSFSRALFAIDRANFDFFVNFTALFIMATLGLWLVRAFGPIGAALGLLIANIATSAVRAGIFFAHSARLSAAQVAD